MTDHTTPPTAFDAAATRERMLSDPAGAYATLVDLGAAWLAAQGAPQRPACERLSDRIKLLYGIDQNWSGIWYHLNGRHRGMDVAAALALLGAIENDLLQNAR
jgi:hypothetical protein